MTAQPLARPVISPTYRGSATALGGSALDLSLHGLSQSPVGSPAPRPRHDRQCSPPPTISIVVLSGEREAMLDVMQKVSGGNHNIHTEILARGDVLASAAQASENKPAIIGSQLLNSNLGLTARQLDVLALMMQGKSNKVICRVLNLAVPTVKNHVSAILRALKVSNRTEAVVAVSELGWRLPRAAQLDLQSSIPARTLTTRIGVVELGGPDAAE